MALEDRTFLEVANVFGADPSRWLPLYDHIMSRLVAAHPLVATRVGWRHQLRGLRRPRPPELPTSVRTFTDSARTLASASVGVGTRRSSVRSISWDFQQLASNPPLDAAQLNARMEESGPNSGKRWVLINTTSPDYSTKLNAAQRKEQHIARIREFIEQIVVAKRHGADGIFLPNPVPRLARRDDPGGEAW